MIGWQWVMRRLLLWCLLAFSAGGCWSEEPRVDGFTAAQWAALKEQFSTASLMKTDPCVPVGLVQPQPACDAAVTLGQELFFEASLSSPPGTTCATCHDPKRWFSDGTALSPTPVPTTGHTMRNTISSVNQVYKPPGTFTWIGRQAPRDVILDVAFPRAMGTTPATVLAALVSIPNANELYARVFPNAPPALDEATVRNVALLLELYVLRLGSLDAPFDRYIAGDTTAIGEDAKRGFELFVGRAMCVECHRGPLFTDDQFHVTGVRQTAGDDGRMILSRDAADLGKFFTPSLRHVADTGPYMHDGSHQTLADVIEFYRWGGDDGGYPGGKDPRMEPLDITDGDARDLEAFLRTLTGAPIPSDLTKDISP